MSVARITEIIAASDKSFDDAVNKGVAKAAESLRGVTSAWVKDQSVTIKDGSIAEYRVVLKITFILE